MEVAKYEVRLYLNGTLVGDVREFAEGLTWARRRTMKGVDSIDFTLNDVLFARWCESHNTTINEALRPLALECRVVRNGIEVVGGFLATMPSYSPKGASADLSMKFDGFLNLLDGVFIYPTETTSKRMDQFIDGWITEANTRSSGAGKSFGFTAGEVDQMETVEMTFDGYKSIKEAIEDRSDNTTGAKQFDVYFHADKTYDVKEDANFGHAHAYTIEYPMRLSGISATSISADEVDGFASKIIAVGSGETSSEGEEDTAIVSEKYDNAAAVEYGYREVLVQESSISVQETLDQKALTALATAEDVSWQPQITLIGREIAPSTQADSADDDLYIWIGDTVTISNTEDVTGSTSGSFRVMELEVKVDGTGAETITPTLERLTDE